MALATKGNKKKSKKGPKGGIKQQTGEQKDMSKMKCFACQKLGHKQEEEETTDSSSSRDR